MKPKFEDLIKTDEYQVFLFVSRANMPANFALHPWFVVNKKGFLLRREVIASVMKYKKEGHIHTNFLLPFQGMRIIPFINAFRWRPKLLFTTEGGEGSVAQRMADFIEASKETYPHLHTYSLLGPNSNTYVQWVLDAFPEVKAKLPWNAFGKNFKK
ncbi:MAG: DUF3750 domain-containing protein [Patescibacteria group bacterium]